jgi:hypothetical protein
MATHSPTKVRACSECTRVLTLISLSAPQLEKAPTQAPLVQFNDRLVLHDKGKTIHVYMCVAARRPVHCAAHLTCAMYLQ